MNVDGFRLKTRVQLAMKESNSETFPLNSGGSTMCGSFEERGMREIFPCSLSSLTYKKLISSLSTSLSHWKAVIESIRYSYIFGGRIDRPVVCENSTNSSSSSSGSRSLDSGVLACSLCVE